MFHRSVIEDFKTWQQNPQRKPLVVRGARQVGKTSAARLFGSQFDLFVEVNLEDEQNRNLFEKGHGIQDLWQAILLRTGHSKTTPLNKTLLFIDEIQESPKAVQSLRYFYEQMPQLFVIAAGSLLEVMLSTKQVSFPVGRVEYSVMTPLSFEEFLVVTKEEAALEAYNQIPNPDYSHSSLLELFHRYTLIGGMPEIVRHYIEYRSVAALAPVYSNLLTSYIDDVSKYVHGQSKQAIMQHCIEQSPFEAGNRITFSGFGNSSYGSREVGESLKTLERAMLIRLLYPSTSTAIPIRPDFKKKPRLQFIDTGLINYFVGLQNHIFEHDDLHGFYRGRLAEHIVGQELLSRANQRLEKLCFWVREKTQATAELDFLAQHAGFLLPIEVKAGSTGTLRSLHQFINRSDAKWAVRFYSGKLGLDTLSTPAGTPYRLLNLPYYLAGRLPEHVDWFLSNKT